MTHQIEGVSHFFGGQHEAGDEVGQEAGDGQRGLDDALQVEAEILEQDFTGPVIVRTVRVVLDSSAAICRIDDDDSVNVTDVADADDADGVVADVDD